MANVKQSKAWKAMERSVAKKFGVRRTPLSGINSGHTHADIIHPTFFVECKYRKRLGLVELFKKVRRQAVAEDKIPLVVLKQMGQQGEIVCMDLDYFMMLINAFDNCPEGGAYCLD